jgi:hypothetical protein
VAVCDLDEARAAAVSARYRRAPASIARGANRRLSRPFVVVASYDHDHAGQILRALKAGRHVFSEKPMCTSEGRRHKHPAGVAVQMQFPAAVWRHLAPSSHVNIFSDASIASLLHANRLRPAAARYFGVDFYELLC